MEEEREFFFLIFSLLVFEIEKIFSSSS